MDMQPYIDQLRADIRAAAALGDEKTQATAAALADSVANSARLTLLSALSDLATEVSTELGDRTVQVAVSGTDAVVQVHAAPSETPSFEEMTGDISRVTLRLVEQLKTRAEEAASQSGQSLNSWLSGAVSGAVRDHMRGYPTGKPDQD